jgi:flagellar hook-associated protein 2
MVSVVGSTGTTLTSTDSTSSTSSTSSSSNVSAPSAASASQSLLQLSGLSSGIDTSSMITQLMAAAGVPRDQVYQQQEWVEWQQDAYRNINTALSTFQTAEQNLQFQSTFNPYKATSSDTTDFSVSTGSNVLQGTYQVQVKQVASAATLVSGSNVLNASNAAAVSTDTVGQPGTFTIQYSSGGSTQTYSASVKGTDTFQTIANDITNANIGLTASFDNATHRFVLSSTSTGAAQSYSISDTSGNIGSIIANGGQASTTTSTTTKSFSGTDADVLITAPGSTTAAEVTQSTNNISALGLNLTVMNQTKDSSGNLINANVNVGVDTDSVYNTISNFVSSYNTLIDTINTQLNSKRDYNYPPLTQSQKSAMTDSQISLWEAKAKNGVLENDPTLQNILDQLQSGVNDPVTGLNNGQNTLTSIGVGTEFMTSSGTLISDPNNTGHLQIDETTLKAAIANNPTQVMKLFTTSDTSTTENDNEGIGQRLYNVANNAITQLVKQAGTPGGAYNDGSYLGNQVSDLSQQLSDWSDRLSKLQTLYTNEFAQMETAMSQLNAQGAYLQQLG